VLVRVNGKDFKACSGVLHDGDAVATDGRSGYRGARTGRHRGGAMAVAKGRLTRGDRAAGDERRRGRAGTRGDVLSPAPERKQGSRRGAEEEGGRERIQGPVCKI
jgi:hypothetical protein